MPKLKISPPWITYYDELDVLFKKDPEIHVIYDEDNRKVNLYVDNPVKASILTAYLPATKKFGRIELAINVIPANGIELIDDCDFGALFEGNGALSFTKTVPDLAGTPIHYVVFKKEVVQFYTDDLWDYYGIRSTLYEDVAREVFDNGLNGIFFATDIHDPNTALGAPLGEWP